MEFLVGFRYISTVIRISTPIISEITYIPILPLKMAFSLLLTVAYIFLTSFISSSSFCLDPSLSVNSFFSSASFLSRSSWRYLNHSMINHDFISGRGAALFRTMATWAHSSFDRVEIHTECTLILVFLRLRRYIRADGRQFHQDYWQPASSYQSEQGYVVEMAIGPAAPEKGKAFQNLMSTSLGEFMT